VKDGHDQFTNVKAKHYQTEGRLAERHWGH